MNKRWLIIITLLVTLFAGIGIGYYFRMSHEPALEPGWQSLENNPSWQEEEHSGIPPEIFDEPSEPDSQEPQSNSLEEKYPDTDDISTPL